MISVFREAVKDALYPNRHGVLSMRNRFLKTVGPEEMTAADIRKLRKSLQLSTAVFASALAVSVKTVEAWERGTNIPSGPALRMMNMIRKYPDLLLETGIFEEMLN